jgi:polyisoprenoid-binding protein YceI
MTQNDTPSTDRRTRLIRFGLIASFVALVLVGAGIWWFLGRSAPEAVNVEDAASVLEGSTTSTTTATTGETSGGSAPEATTTTTPTGGASLASLDGTWTVDTTIGEFAFEDATSSFAGFRIEEQLRGIGSTTAVGRSPEVAGTLTIDGPVITSTTMEVDLTAIVSNDSRRDDRIQDALETPEFPTATFTLTEPIDLGDVPAPAETVSATARGELTVHGVTNPVEFALDARLVDDVIVVVGSTNIVFSDFGVEVPSAPIVLSASDNGVVEFQLFFRKN